VSLKLTFMGTPDFALPTLAKLLSAGHEILSVYTRPPRQAGRGLGERLSPVHRFALDHGLVVETPASLKNENAQRMVLAREPDAAVVVAYGLILPAPVLAGPRLGSYNLHASLLPRWRGAAPISRAIMAGDEKTGITIMRMTQGLDEGPICLSAALPIRSGETAGELHDRLAHRGADLMIEALDRLERGTLVETSQPETGVSYAAKIEKSETRLDFTRPAQEVLNRIHGLSPWPGAWCAFDRDGRRHRLKILKAGPAEGRGAPGAIIDDDFAIACGEGALRPLIVQREGKSPLPRAEFLRGLALAAGDRLR
jgi:methionyl-tRNA formyltransferase